MLEQCAAAVIFPKTENPNQTITVRHEVKRQVSTLLPLQQNPDTEGR